MGRAPCCDKANVKKGPWSPEEDAKLKAYIDKYGTGGNWIALPQKIGLKRCGKSCRLRWLNYLRPNIKHGGFTEEEDNIICNLYISIGSRWSIIAAQLPGRTDNDIKNYWNTRLKKKLLGRRRQNWGAMVPSQEPKDHPNGDENANSLQNLSSSALERLQLHMQLQTLQNPFSSFYNNPSLWPKMIQTIHSLNENQNLNNLTHQMISSSPHQPAPLDLDHHHQQDYSPLINKPANGFSSSDQSSLDMKGDQSNVLGSGFTQGELDDLLNNKPCNFVAMEGQVGELDCFKEMDGLKDGNLAWWSNDQFDANSASSSSWDSANMLDQYQDYGLGYSMQ